MPELWIHDRKTCDCVRCRGFQKGHTINAGRPSENLVTHGAKRSPLVLRPEAERIAETVRPHLPIANLAFEGTFQSYCILLARIQRAHDALEKAEQLVEEQDRLEYEWNLREHEDDEVFVRLEPKFNTLALGEDLRRWQASALKHASELGLTPQSAAKILKDAEIGKLAAHMQLTKERAAQVPVPALEKMRSAMLEALEDTDVIDTV